MVKERDFGLLEYFVSSRCRYHGEICVDKSVVYLTVDVGTETRERCVFYNFLNCCALNIAKWYK